MNNDSNENDANNWKNAKTTNNDNSVNNATNQRNANTANTANDAHNAKNERNANDVFHVINVNIEGNVKNLITRIMRLIIWVMRRLRIIRPVRRD